MYKTITHIAVRQNTATLLRKRLKKNMEGDKMLLPSEKLSNDEPKEIQNIAIPRETLLFRL